MKKFKKTTAFITCLMMAVTATATTGYAKDNRYFVSYFDNFDGYVTSDTYPENWKAFVTGVSSTPDGVVEETSLSQTMKLQSGAKPMYEFGGIAQEGILHISFDMKLADATATSGVGIMATTDYTNSKHPSSFWRSSSQVRPSLFMNVSPTGIWYSTEGNNFLGSFAGKTTTGFTAGADWHKYDLIVDLDNNKYTPYIDGQKFKLITITTKTEVDENGEEITTTETVDDGYYENIGFNRSIKNIYFEAGTDAYIDNFAVENYKWSADTFNAPVMKAEYANGNVNVSFSEYMSATADASAFTVTNIETGAVYTPSAVTKQENSGYTLSFAESLPSAAYTVTSTGLTGGLSNKAVINDADFAIAKTMLANEMPYTLLSENFAAYTGKALPTGWLNYGDDYEASGSAAEDCLKVDWTAPSGRGLTMQTSYRKGSIYKLFDNGAKINGEKFSVEFDVKSGSAKWAIGLVRDSDMLDYDGTTVRSTMDQAKDSSTEGRVDNEAYNRTRVAKERNFIVGSNTAGKLIIPKSNYGFHLEGTEVREVADISTTDWTNVKLDFDVNSGKVTVYIDGANKGAFDFPMSTFAHVSHYNFSTKAYTLYYGIEGLRLYFKGATAPANTVSFANLKVLNGHSYAASMDFENRVNSASDTGWVPSQYRDRPRIIRGGVNFVDYYNTLAFVMKTDAGVGGGTAIKFSPSTTTSTAANNIFYLPLDRPIQKGYGFAVEFDAKGTSGMNNWILRAGKSKDSTDNQPIARLENGVVKVGKYGQNAYDGGNTAITIDADKWYHYKVIVSTTTRVTIEVTDENGNKKTTYKGWGGTALTNILNYYDVGNIHFVLNSTDTTQSLTIDNFKTWQIAVGDNSASESVVNEAYMKTVTAKNYNGTDSFISKATSSISADTKAIEVEFTGALADAAAITLTQDGTAIGTKSVSGNKCVISFKGTPLTAGSTLVLKVPAGLSVGGVATADAHTYTMTVADDGGLKVTSIDLYEEVSINASDEGKGITAAPVDILAMNIAGTLVSPKLIIKGYNSGAATKLFAANGDFSILEGSSKLVSSGADSGVKDIAAGDEFEIELDVTNLLSGSGNTLKGFAWNYPTMKALIENYSHAK